MYAIATIVYGVPVDEKIDRLVHERSFEDLEELGWEILYSGSSNISPGFLGVELCDLPTIEDSTLVSTLRFAPTDEERARAQALIDAQPEEIKALLPPPDVYIIWSTS
jgi:hypothetical protein